MLASGLSWSNIEFFSLFGYPATPTLLIIFILLTLGSILFLSNASSLRIRPSLVIVPSILLGYALLINGFLAGYIQDAEWIKSFALLCMSVGVLFASSMFQLRERDLPALVKLSCYFAYGMGGLGILQFLVSSVLGHTVPFVPEVLRIRDNNLGWETWHRSYAFGMEPSYYGTGMVVIATINLTMLYIVPVTSRQIVFRWGALLVALLGLVFSVSLAAWGLMFLVLLGWFISQIRWHGLILRLRKITIRGQRYVLWFVALLAIPVLLAVIPYMTNRLSKVVEGEDTSSELRVLVAINLIWEPGTSLKTNFLGYGLGRQSENPRLSEEIFRTKGYAGEGELVIWSAYAYTAMTMGWVGLAIFLWLIFDILRQPNNLPIPTLHLVVLVVVYLQTQGVLLSGEWWGLLALVSLLKSCQFGKNRAHA
jgi:hypothetical protein